MTEQERDRLLEDADDYNRPPPPPREEMWAVVREALPRDGRGVDPTDDLTARRARRNRDRLRRWSPWALGLAAAATLAVGFGLGRITGVEPAPAGSGPRADAPADAGSPAPRGAGASLPFRLAAAEHMGEAEAMLTLFRSSDRSEDRTATARWARDLLSTTRLLLDSRVAEDPATGELLSELELVLVQIVAATGTPDEEAIEDGISDRQLMTKLRSASALSTTAM